MKQLSNKARWIISAALVLVILICVASIAIPAWKRHQARKRYEQLKTAALVENDRDSIEIPQIDFPTLSERYEEFPEVDFAPLWEVNEEVCAWIRVPGTKVDYPVLRNGDADDPYDTYYLEYTIDGVEGRPGTIYMEPCNSPEFTDYNTVLYGHNMNDETMFGTLHRYDDETFFLEHPYIYIVTPEKNLVYEIASAVFLDDRHIMFSYDFRNEDDRQEYLELLAESSDERNHYREGVTPTAEDSLLTLSTCVLHEKDRRFLITAVLRAEEYKEEGI